MGVAVYVSANTLQIISSPSTQLKCAHTTYNKLQIHSIWGSVCRGCGVNALSKKESSWRREKQLLIGKAATVGQK